MIALQQVPDSVVAPVRFLSLSSQIAVERLISMRYVTFVSLCASIRLVQSSRWFLLQAASPQKTRQRCCCIETIAADSLRCLSFVFFPFVLSCFESGCATVFSQQLFVGATPSKSPDAPATGHSVHFFPAALSATLTLVADRRFSARVYSAPTL